MARSAHKSLSPGEAKLRLREAASHSGLTPWVRSHPYEALSIGLATGMALASRRAPPLALVFLARRLIQTLL
jgi:hypothetical protein